MTNDGLTQDLAREDLARLLAGCYYQPEQQLGDEGVFDALAHAGAQLDPALEILGRRLGTAFATLSLEALLLDYSRLFLGPFDIPAKPYGSIWLDGSKAVMGDSTMALLDLYRAAGFELADDFREVPDHIAAELEFLYLLNFQINEARRNQQAEAADRVVALKRHLLHHHLGRWVPPFTAAMQAAAETPFYQTLAELTARFVALELQQGRS